MRKVVPHRKRYLVQYSGRTGWHTYSSHRTLWMARQTARFRESLGYFDYRVVDTEA